MAASSVPEEGENKGRANEKELELRIRFRELELEILRLKVERRRFEERSEQSEHRTRKSVRGDVRCYVKLSPTFRENPDIKKYLAAFERLSMSTRCQLSSRLASWCQLWEA